MKGSLCSLLILGLYVASESGVAGEKELEVPKEELKIEGAVTGKESEVEVRPLNPKFKPFRVPGTVYVVKLSAKKNYQVDLSVENRKEFKIPLLALQDKDGKTLALSSYQLRMSPPTAGTL